MNKKLIFIIISVASLIVLPAFAFKVHFIHVFATGIHEDITEEAINKNSGFKVYWKNPSGAVILGTIKDDLIPGLREENTENDERGLEDGTLHFDDSRINASSNHAYTMTAEAIKALNGGDNYLSGSSRKANWDAATHLFGDGSAVQVALGAATHTVQDFFAHSTWVETNLGINAFSGADNNYLNPFNPGHVPIPKIGILQDPFGEAGFTNTNGVSVISDAPGTNNNDHIDGHCNDSGYDATGDKQITTAYYDYRMSAVGPYPESGPDFGGLGMLGSNPITWKTDVWNGWFPAIGSGLISQDDRFPQSGTKIINWPKKRCIHGDELVGINKDSEVASGSKATPGNYFRAYNAAKQATRNLVMHFLNESKAPSGSLSDIGCTFVFDCSTADLPSITIPVQVTKIVKKNTGEIVTNFSGQSLYGFDFSSPSNSIPASMLEVSFGGNICEMIDENISSTFDGNGKSHFYLCNSSQPGALKLYQKANKSLSLLEFDDFPFDRVSTKGVFSFGESIALWIENARLVLKSVVYTLINVTSDITKIVEKSADNTLAVTFANVYEAGSKSIQVSFRTFSDNVYFETTIPITITASTIPSAIITGATSDATTQPGPITTGGNTDDATPTLNGTISKPLANGEKVNVYDGASQFVAPAVVSGNTWTFTPTTPLSIGLHSFTADVTTADGTPGARSAPPYSLTVVVATQPPASTTIEIPATAFVRGTNVALSTNGFGADTLMNAPPYAGIADAAEWDIVVPVAGRYELFAEYAAALSRPVAISFNGSVKFSNALADITGGWLPVNRQISSQGIVDLPAGAVTMRLERSDVFPHIKGFVLVPIAIPSSGSFIVAANSYAGTVFTIPTGTNSCVFSAAGAWSFGQGIYDANGYTGTPVPAWADTRMTSVPIGRLVASAPDGFKSIGTSATQAYPAGSVLTFMMNDAADISMNGYSDNGGNLTVSYSCSSAATFADYFDGTSLNTAVWNPLNWSGGPTLPYGLPTVGNGMLHLANCQGADTNGKVMLSGSKIVIESRFAGQKSWGRDSVITLADPTTGLEFSFRDTNYEGWGQTIHLAQNGIGNFNMPLGGTTSAFKEYRITLRGANVTVERGDTLAVLTERFTVTLPRSVTDGNYYLKLGTGGCDGFYSPADFDWIRVNTY
jgi:hypothetical protein